jgi:nitric oxide synthase-interacting protein
MCALSLQPVEDPVVTPSGGLYSREAIISYLVRANEELAVWRTKYEEQQAEDVAKHCDGVAADQSKAIEDFKSKNSGGVVTSVEDAVRDHASKRVGELKAAGYDMSTAEEKVASLKRSAPWLSTYTPTADAERIAEPPKRPNSPFSGQALRLKDLKPVKLLLNSDSDVPSYICSISQKSLTTQPVVAITSTGTVMLKTVYTELAESDKVDPVTGKKFKEKDVVELRKSASGYASSGVVESRKYCPTMT